jgi:hypothetical protein
MVFHSACMNQQIVRLFPLFVFVGTAVNILRNRDQLLLVLGLADTYEWSVFVQLVSVVFYPTLSFRFGSENSEEDLSALM